MRDERYSKTAVVKHNVNVITMLIELYSIKILSLVRRNGFSQSSVGICRVLLKGWWCWVTKSPIQPFYFWEKDVCILCRCLMDHLQAFWFSTMESSHQWVFTSVDNIPMHISNFVMIVSIVLFGWPFQQWNKHAGNRDGSQIFFNWIFNGPEKQRKPSSIRPTIFRCF